MVVVDAWRTAAGTGVVLVDVAQSGLLEVGGHTTNPTSWTEGNADRIETDEAWDGAQASPETPQ